MSSSSQPPSSVRLSTSRPRVSPPSSAAAEARENGLVTNSELEYGAMAGPIAATRITQPAMASPAAPRGVRTARPSTANASGLRAMRASLGPGQPSPRAHGEGYHVGRDVYRHVEGGEDQHDALDLRDIPVRDRR